MSLPPGPRAPAAIQTYEWIARPTALMRRCQARYGEPFTLNIAWADAPMVFVSDPQDVKRVFAAGADTLRAGASSTVLEPFAGPRSILVLDGDEHLNERRLMLPPFHGDALARWRETIARARRRRARRLDARPARPRAPPHAGADARGDPARRVRERRPGAARRHPPHARHDDLAAAAVGDGARATQHRAVADLHARRPRSRRADLRAHRAPPRTTARCSPSCAPPTPSPPACATSS